MPFSLSSHKDRSSCLSVSPLVGEVDLHVPAFLPTGKTDSLIPLFPSLLKPEGTLFPTSHSF